MSASHFRHCEPMRSNPAGWRGIPAELDCFVAFAPRNDEESSRARGATRGSRRDMDVLLLHQRSPFLDLAVDALRQRIRSASAGLETEFGKGLLDIEHHENAVHLVVELLHDRRWRARRREQTEPDRIVEA